MTTMDKTEGLSHIVWKLSGTKLKNGWAVSGIFVYDKFIRVQLMPPNAEVRKTLEAPSLEKALQDAVKFSETTEAEYISWLFEDDHCG